MSCHTNLTTLNNESIQHNTFLGIFNKYISVSTMFSILEYTLLIKDVT